MSKRSLVLETSLFASLLISTNLAATVYLEQIEVPLRIPPMRGFPIRSQVPADSQDPRFLSGRFALTREGRQFLNKTTDRFPGETNRIALYTCPDVLKRTHSGNSRVIIDVGRQRVYLESEGLIALETQVSTARTGKSTPLGTFSMTERVSSGKISSLYGVSMPYWMRLGDSEFGVHAGYLPGYPASAGCIRLPLEAARIIYEKTGTGSTVTITRNYGGPRVAASQLIDPNAKAPSGQVLTPVSGKAPNLPFSGNRRQNQGDSMAPQKGRRVPASRRLPDPPTSSIQMDQFGQTFRRVRI